MYLRLNYRILKRQKIQPPSTSIMSSARGLVRMVNEIEYKLGSIRGGHLHRYLIFLVTFGF